MSSRELIKLLEAAGFELKRIKGSHHQFKKRGYPALVSVPHPKKDLKPGTVRSILKKAGLR